MSNLPNSAPYWNTGGPQIYSEADINDAIEAGILPAEEASILKQHLAEPDPQVNEEAYRMGGFNDIFTYTACLALIVPIYYTTRHLYENVLGEIVPVIMALLTWGLTEYFVRIKHLPLTARVLSYTFDFWWLSMLTFNIFIFLYPNSASSCYRGLCPQYLLSMTSTLASSIVIWFHWKRFQIPISLGLMATSIAYFIIMSLHYLFPTLEAYKNTMALVAGVLLMVCAIYVDSSDPERRTKRADVAFWLYIASAYLMLSPILTSLNTGHPYSSFPMPEAINIDIFVTGIIVISYGAVAFISLCLDRQVTLVSSVSYMLYALTVHISGNPDLRLESSHMGYYFSREEEHRSTLAVIASNMESVGISGTIVSITLLLLVIFWKTGRVWALSILPKSIQKKLPPAPNTLELSSNQEAKSNQEASSNQEAKS